MFEELFGQMKPSPVSPEWRKKRQKMAEGLIRKGEMFFKKQELIRELKRRIKNVNRDMDRRISF